MDSAVAFGPTQSRFLLPPLPQLPCPPSPRRVKQESGRVTGGARLCWGVEMKRRHLARHLKARRRRRSRFAMPPFARSAPLTALFTSRGRAASFRAPHFPLPFPPGAPADPSRAREEAGTLNWRWSWQLLAPSPALT